MPKLGFTEALDHVLAADSRYDREAYLFLRDALDFTLKSRKKQKSDLSRHVSGQELLEGLRLYALQEFGPMVPTVFETWNIHRCSDVGQMVFNLIKGEIFDKTENDSLEDFENVYDFHDAFVKPFLPEKPFIDLRIAPAAAATKVAKTPKSPKAVKTSKATAPKTGTLKAVAKKPSKPKKEKPTTTSPSDS